ncbi:MAG: PQQ-binding-like beta-propeller repeat protein [Candidatus Bathyarchaeia archaeon]|jgi:hypothetical protein
MKFAKNKTTICAITIITILALSSFAVLVPKVNAQAAAGKLDVPTWCFINAFPSPVGVGQTISLFAWLDIQPPTAMGAYGDRWYNLTIIETKPDGTTVTLGPYTSDPVGTIFTTVIPATTGNYTFKFVFPGQLLAGNNLEPVVQPVAAYPQIGNYYEPATSTPVTVNVQSTPIPTAPAYPLPTQYWSNPVSQSGHQNWAYITGDWLATGVAGSKINDYTQPPTTAHIAWTIPLTYGGVAGLPSAISTGGDNYYTGLTYEGLFSNPIIMGGQLYYNIGRPPQYGFADVNLQTGQQVWYQNGTGPQQSFMGYGYPQLTMGQELDYESPNQHGTVEYLWSVYTAANGSNVWAMYDPVTGNWICNLWNVPASSEMFGASMMITDPSGSFIIYTPDFANKIFSVWNSTATIQDTYPFMGMQYGNSSNSYWEWRPPTGAQVDATVGTTNYAITGNLPANAASATLMGIDTADQLAVYSTAPAMIGMASYPTPDSYTQFAISTNPATIGQVTWSRTYPWPTGNVTLEYGCPISNGVFTLFEKEPRLWMGFSATTGAQIWTSTTPEVSNHLYLQGYSAYTYDGVFYSSDSIGEGGSVYAYNVTTGALLWSYTAPSMGYTGYWDNIPTTVGAFASGNIYWSGSEHSPGPNLEPGFMLGDMNATTGVPIWNITFWDEGTGTGNIGAIADGYLVALNSYDMQIYSFGMGPTQTTVGTDWSNRGQNLVIQGSVLDISAGTTQSNIAARFPQGVAAVSDASMTPYMEYVYMQNPIPANTTGVLVQVTLIDPNGNTINLPTVTSDASGHYGLDYKVPNVPGTYTAIATFSGTDAYWPSYSETTFQVDPAPAATPAPTATPTSVANMYFVPMSIGIIVLIIIVLAVVVLSMLRKRP